ncbi:hypothetical protein C5748_07300 [Phyllobacterium phragmitis]|uniref:Uncharacterized protein n=1 Tax=Phyllobacterium phragmitis TaxID=2670329 RepID=A0A2S9IV21_9HYPH|nr:hypothetical protein [Phyllobacterium phragmitis]PRD44377.1 hypothetical protein C5748_07300 [Phyllobacterium phragmitis]
MPTIRTEIGPSEVAGAKELAKAGQAKPFVFSDTVEKGLRLVVEGHSVRWQLNWGNKTKSLGGLDKLKNAKAARETARKVRDLLRDGVNPKAFLTGKAVGKSDGEATAAAEKATKVAAGGWTWETLVAEYTDGYLAKPRIVRGTLRPPSEGSVRTARDALSIPEADVLKEKLLTEMDIPDLEGVRDAAALRGKTPSRAFVANAKAALSFAKRKHAGKSGLHGVTRWWMEVQPLDETATQPRTRMPSLRDIGRVLYVAEKHRVAGGRKAARETSEVTVCAMWWLILTAQRSSAAMAVERARILPWPEGPAGWKVAAWEEAQMKSKRFHALPIPPRLVLLTERAIAVAPRESQFVFPRLAQKAGDADKPISTTATRDYLTRLRGVPPKSPKGRKRKDAKRKAQELKGRLVNHLEGVPHFSAHDLRRTFATVCSDRKVRPDAISAVLDHAGLETGQKMLRSADVTRLAYDYSQRLAVKAEAVEAWCTAVFEAVEAEWEANRPAPPLSFRAPPPPLAAVVAKVEDARRKGAFSPEAPWYVLMERVQQEERKGLSLAGLSRSEETEAEA